jgi:HSP20 family protein
VGCTFIGRTSETRAAPSAPAAEATEALDSESENRSNPRQAKEEQMAITRYTRSPGFAPWRDLEEVSNRLARLFDEGSGHGLSTGTNGGSWIPSVNVEESKEELVLTAELPGMSEEDISIEMENNVLTISGEKTEERTEGDQERRYHLWERRYGSFQRSFTLPRTVKAEDIRATYDQGVLTVHLPKVPEAKGRKITVEPVQK